MEIHEDGKKYNYRTALQFQLNFIVILLDVQ